LTVADTGRRDRVLERYNREQQSDDQPDTSRFPVVEAPARVIRVERQVCEDHKECEQRIRALEMWRALAEDRAKPIRIIIAAALGGGGVALGAWLLGHFVQ
jgi:hypothetical protein